MQTGTISEQYARDVADWCAALYAAGKQYPAWSEPRAKLWSESLIVFVEELVRPPMRVPEFHKEWYRDLCRHQFLVLLAPRDHAKSSAVAIYYPLWRILMDCNSTMMIVASSSGVASLEVGSIKNLIEKNEAIVSGFGRLFSDPQAKANNEEIILPRDDYSLKDPTVVALGVGSSVLTRRVVNGAIIGDDLVRDDEVQTQAQIERVRNWIDGVLIPVAEPSEQIVFIGTRKADGDYYDTQLQGKQLVRTTEFRQENEVDGVGQGFKVVVYDAQPDEALRPELVLWGDKWGAPALEARKVIIGAIQFARNYRNQVVTSATSVFPIEWFTKCYDFNARIEAFNYETRLKKIIAVDIAAGLSETTAYFVAMVVGLDREASTLHLLALVRDRMGLLDQIRALSGLCDRFLPEYVVVENNGVQSLVIDAYQAGIPNFTMVETHTDAKKHSPEEGVPFLQPIIESGRLKFPMGDAESKMVSEIVVKELNRFGHGERSDTVMTLWFAARRLITPGAKPAPRAAVV